MLRKSHYSIQLLLYENVLYLWPPSSTHMLPLNRWLFFAPHPATTCSEENKIKSRDQKRWVCRGGNFLIWIFYPFQSDCSFRSSSFLIQRCSPTSVSCRLNGIEITFRRFFIHLFLKIWYSCAIKIQIAGQTLQNWSVQEQVARAQQFVRKSRLLLRNKSFCKLYSHSVSFYFEGHFKCGPF